MMNYYDTSQTFQRENVNFVVSTQKHIEDQSSNDELLLLENIDSSQRTLVIFKAKLILLYENDLDEAINIMRSVEDEYYVKMKIIFKMISNWTVNVIFDVKLHLVTSVEEQRLKRDIVHNWIFYINSDSMIKDVIIHKYLKQRQNSRFWTEKMYMHHNLEDEMMINIRDYEQLSLLQLKFQSATTQFSEIKLYMKDINDHLAHIHHIIYNLFTTSVTKKIIIATFISTAQNDQFLAQWRVFQHFCAWERVFSSTHL